MKNFCIHLLLLGLLYILQASPNPIILNKDSTHYPLIKVSLVTIEQWCNINSNGTLTGIYPDIYRALAKKLPYRFQLKTAPYPRVIEQLLTNKSDMTTTVPPTENSQHLIIGTEIWSIKMMLFSLQDKPIKRYNDIISKRVGLIRGAMINPQFDADTRIIKTTSAEHINLMKMLEVHRLDAIAADTHIITHLNAKYPSIKLTFAKPVPLSTVPIHLMFSKKSLHLHRQPEIEEAFRDLRDSGTIREIILDHFAK